MTINLNNSKDFIEVIENAKTQLIPVYSKWIESLYKQKDYWHPKENPNGYRIRWSKESEANKEMKDVFNKAGIYLFGTSENIIRYVGMTEKQTLHERLSRRYVGEGKSRHCQCQIAEDITFDKKEYEKCPDDVFDFYKNKYSNKAQRLWGALDFAYHGIDDIWFTVLPVEDRYKSLISPLEAMLIHIAREYNRKHWKDKYPKNDPDRFLLINLR
ncbi:MAG: hypothetical protein WCE94_00060 [Candidatus Methanoperedens sp.]